MGIDFEARPSGVDEERISADHPRTYALRLAFAKATAVARDLPETEPAVVIAADTVVALGLVLYGKPATAAEAERMLLELSGKTHEVISAVAVATPGKPHVHLQSRTARVTFRPLTVPEIRDYIATGEPFDKAGGYGIQGRGGDLIERLDGDYHTVMGLPCDIALELLDAAGADVSRLEPPEPPARWAPER